MQIASGLCSILKRLEISLTGPEKVSLGNNSKDFMHVEHLPDSLYTFALLKLQKCYIVPKREYTKVHYFNVLDYKSNINYLNFTSPMT